jgi:hypothetical protein
VRVKVAYRCFEDLRVVEPATNAKITESTEEAAHRMGVVMPVIYVEPLLIEG